MPSTNDHLVLVIVTTWTPPPQFWLQSNQATHVRVPRTRQEEPTTEVHAVTQAPLDAIIVARTETNTPPQQNHTAKMPPSTGLLVVADSEMIPQGERHEDTSIAFPADLRFPSGAKAVARRSTTP